MIMYKLYNDVFSGKVIGVKRLADNACIPLDPDNTDYAEYLKWIEAGNSPLPAEEKA